MFETQGGGMGDFLKSLLVSVVQWWIMVPSSICINDSCAWDNSD